jgi:integrase
MNLTDEPLSDKFPPFLGVINSKCFLGARLFVMVLLLLDTGIRASELCTLTLATRIWTRTTSR